MFDVGQFLSDIVR